MYKMIFDCVCIGIVVKKTVEVCNIGKKIIKKEIKNKKERF